MFLGTFIKVHSNRSAVQGGAEESWKQAVSLKPYNAGSSNARRLSLKSQGENLTLLLSGGVLLLTLQFAHLCLTNLKSYAVCHYYANSFRVKALSQIILTVFL